MQSLLITDANIWIDLYRGGLLEHVFALPYQFVTTEFVLNELREPEGAPLVKNGLQIEVIDGAGIAQLVTLKRELNNSSIADVSCFYLAQKHGWPVITGDGHLRRSLQHASLEVHGVLWLLDELERTRLMLPGQLALALEAVLKAGARLPKKDCEHRLALWRSQ